MITNCPKLKQLEQEVNYIMYFPANNLLNTIVVMAKKKIKTTQEKVRKVRITDLKYSK